MNQDWKNFLIGRGAVIDADLNTRFEACPPAPSKALCAISDQGVLAVHGRDAESLLQGQATCDFRNVTESRSSLGAFCNAKGRALTVFLAVKGDSGYLLVMPVSLLQAVKKRLQMYVLRTDVKLEDASGQWCVMGLCHSAPDPAETPDPFQLEAGRTLSRDGLLVVGVPGDPPRTLILAPAENAESLWLHYSQAPGFSECGSDQWQHRDILSGVPALCSATSEEFVPQMINLDLLGGISLQKGCYTGQEIVARMHYLGKLKRRMFQGRCANPPAPGTPVFQAGDPSEQSVGTVVAASSLGTPYPVLAVVQLTHAESAALRLASPQGEPLELMPN